MEQHKLVVTAIGADKKPLATLRDFLHTAGVECRTAMRLGSARSLLSGAGALVLLAEGFPRLSVRWLLRDLRRKRPYTVVVVVARRPDDFRQLRASKNSDRVLVIETPCAPWTILDAIRMCHRRRAPADA